MVSYVPQVKEEHIHRCGSARDCGCTVNGS